MPTIISQLHEYYLSQEKKGTVTTMTRTGKPHSTGLKIISKESPDTMTGQIHFGSVTYRFWPVKFIRKKTLKTLRTNELKLALHISEKQPFFWYFRRTQRGEIQVEILPNTKWWNIKETYGRLIADVKSFAIGSFPEHLVVKIANDYLC